MPLPFLAIKGSLGSAPGRSRRCDGGRLPPAASDVSRGWRESKRRQRARALTIVAEGGHPDIAKLLKGFGSEILELALRFRGDVYRVVYAVRLGNDSVGRPRVPEEVEDRNQDTRARDRPGA